MRQPTHYSALCSYCKERFTIVDGTHTYRDTTGRMFCSLWHAELATGEKDDRPLEQYLLRF